MANPNIVNVTSIYGKVAGQAVGTSATAIVSNSSGSGKILKINSLAVANIAGNVAASVTVQVFKNQATSFSLASTVSVPENSTLVVISKDTSIYLEENDSLRILANASDRLHAICSYEEIS